jgi:hypothetical protein
MAQIKVETTVNRQYESESESVEVFGREEKDVVLTREIEDVEEMVWAIEATTHEVIYHLWEDVKDDEEFEDYGWKGYPKGDVTISDSYDCSWHDVVEFIAERDDVENPAGIYLDLRFKSHTPDAENLDALFKDFLEYCAEKGIDTNYYTHGKKSGKDRRDYL